VIDAGARATRPTYQQVLSRHPALLLVIELGVVVDRAKITDDGLLSQPSHIFLERPRHRITLGLVPAELPRRFNKFVVEIEVRCDPVPPRPWSTDILHNQMCKLKIMHTKQGGNPGVKPPYLNDLQKVQRLANH